MTTRGANFVVATVLLMGAATGGKHSSSTGAAFHYSSRCGTTALAFVPTLPTCRREVSVDLSTPSNEHSKWDHLYDEDDEAEMIFGADGQPLAPPPTPTSFRDMKYIEPNVMRQNDHFEAIQSAAGKELLNDVYANDPKTRVFWFIGKVARVSDVTPTQAVQRQYPLMEQHAARLRPMELYPKLGDFDFWIAPGDSEMDVAYNKADLQFLKVPRKPEESLSQVSNVQVGFQGEVYRNQEEGFRTLRTQDGWAVKEEINSPRPVGLEGDNDNSQFRAPTDEEMQQIQKATQGRDIRDLYEEQEARAAAQKKE